MRNLITSLSLGDRRSPLLGGAPISSRQATWLFLRWPENLTEEERETIAQLCKLDTEVDVAYDLVQQFACMMRDRAGDEQLDGWFEKVARSPLTALHPFVAGIFQDKAAVQAGLALSWSQGQTKARPHPTTRI